MATNGGVVGATTPTPALPNGAKTGSETPTAADTAPSVFTFDVTAATEGSAVPSPRRRDGGATNHISTSQVPTDLLLATQSPDVPGTLPTSSHATQLSSRAITTSRASNQKEGD